MRPLIGVAGIGLIQGIDQMPSTLPLVDIVKIVSTIVVAVGTLIKMFKKPKEVISNQNT